MDKSKIKKFKKSVLVFAIVFVGLFIFRLIYGYQNQIPSSGDYYHLESIESDISVIRKRNYASIKYKTSNQPNKGNIDQKYEKIAQIRTKSSEFEHSESMVRTNIKSLNGLIQFEDKTGNEGNRRLSLTIGVPPENFEQLYLNLIKIGNVQERQITKKDKTNEYNELKAKKNSLEKIRQSLIDLKSKNGKINEYMLLENRILEIEQQLQELGVSLGDFDSENEFCTVKFTLSEGKIIAIGSSRAYKKCLGMDHCHLSKIATSILYGIPSRIPGSTIA